MSTQVNYRIWWKWDEGGVMYRVSPDVLECTPHSDTWNACGRWPTVADALEFIGRTNAGRRVVYTITVEPHTYLDERMQEFESAQIIRRRQESDNETK
jgi:hypothetical protein